MRAPALLFLLAAGVIDAQPADPPVSTVATIHGDVADAYDCRLELFGVPRLDGFSGSWVVAYTAAGPECDDAQGELSRRGSAAGIAFMRRPNLSQLRTLLEPMLRAAELASGCRITMRGRPTFDIGSSRWFVHVTAEGAACATAVRDFSGQAGALDVVVVENSAPTLQRR